MTRHLRVARNLATDPTIPKWLRALLIFGLLPIPGPVDNVALLAGLAILIICHRDRIAYHYAQERMMVPVVPLDTWGAWS